MVEISKSGSGEDLGWVTGPGYSTTSSAKNPLRLPERPLQPVDGYKEGSIS